VPVWGWGWGWVCGCGCGCGADGVALVMWVWVWVWVWVWGRRGGPSDVGGSLGLTVGFWVVWGCCAEQEHMHTRCCCPAVQHMVSEGCSWRHSVMCHARALHRFVA
jgi:hypothetical protein